MVVAEGGGFGPVSGLGYRKAVNTRPLVQFSDEGVIGTIAPIAEEVPVAFVYSGRPHAVMMATPGDLEDFAYGFTLSEEIVASVAQIFAVDVTRHSRGIELGITVPSDAVERLAERGRALAGRTGCGLCGVESIAEAVRAPHVVRPTLTLDPEALWRAGAALEAQQAINRETHSVHAAAWASRDGALRVAREDVGRHNALDKVLGALARSATDPAEGFLIVTSRASFELVQKAAAAGVPLLAAVSRPTGLAIALAESAGICLVGLLRGRTASVYTHAERLRTGVAH